MGVKDSSIGRLIDRLQRDDLLVRMPSKKDRRVYNVEITQKGEDIFGQLIHIGEEFNDQLTKGIPDEELEIFDKVQALPYSFLDLDESRRSGAEN